MIQAGLGGAVCYLFRVNHSKVECDGVSGKNHRGNCQSQNDSRSETAKFWRRPAQLPAIHELQPGDRQQDQPKLAGDDDDFARQGIRPPKECRGDEALCRHEQQQGK